MEFFVPTSQPGSARGDVIGAHNVAAPQQNIQQSRAFQVVQQHFAHANIERPAGALVRNLQLFGRCRPGSRIQLTVLIQSTQDFVTAAAKMVETKSFLTKGSSDRPRATAPMTRFRITHGSPFPLGPVNCFPIIAISFV
jgi:hypothetical protein